MNRNEDGLHIKNLLEGIGIAAVSAIALYAIPRDKNALQGADTTTWLYRNLGPQGMKTALMAVFVALLIYGIWRIVAGARNLWRRD